MAVPFGKRARSKGSIGLLGIALVLSGCPSSLPRQERRWGVCTCEYMTDMDQPGKISFEVCGDPAQQKHVARSCALGSGVGAVLECVCKAGSGAACLDNETCRDVSPK